MTDPTAPGPERLSKLLASLAHRHVLVVGDVMLDRYVNGDVRRISPEAPIPVLRARGRHAVPGGAANVALNIAAMGGKATLVGVVGDDAAAAELMTALNASGGVASALVAVPDRPTTVKTRFVSGGHQLLRLDEEDETPRGIAPAAVLAEVASALATGAEIVVLSDYAKGVLTDRVLADVLAAAHAAGLRVLADPKRASFAAYRGVDVLTPNEIEAARAAGVLVHDDEGAAVAGLHALAAAEAGAVLVTRAARGLTLVQRAVDPIHIPARARDVADVSGAGDTLIAGLALALAAGATLDEASWLANAAAGIAVSKLGTATVGFDELTAELEQRDLLALDTKIVSRGSAAAQTRAWRAAGYSVGFTNGCFDLIHPGHVRLLARARAQCDRLVVGLNTDASVARLKGPSRPIQTEAARSTVLAAMSSVDLVVPFEEDTPENLIYALRPDLLFKGADYRIDEVVGAAFVRSQGGDVRLIALEDGHSTTGIVARIAAGRMDQ